MEEKTLSFNTNRLKDGCTFEECVSSHINPDDSNKIVMKFDNYYKMINFYRIYKLLKDVFSREYQERKKFLELGYQQIQVFKEKASKIKEDVCFIAESLKEENLKLAETHKLLKEKMIISDAEEKRISEIHTKIKIESDNTIIKKDMINARLSESEHLLETSKEEVLKVNKSHISEIKAMNCPPEQVRKTIEIIYYIFACNDDAKNCETCKKVEWPILQGFLKKDDFLIKLRKISSSDSTRIPTWINKIFKMISSKNDLEKNMDDSFSLVRVNKASKTCGIFYQWIESLVKYKEMVEEVLPLKNELKEVEDLLLNQSKDLEKKELELSQLKESIYKLQCDMEENERITNYKSIKLNNLIETQRLLNSVTDKLEIESVAWTQNSLECPLNYMLKGKHILKYCKNIFILDDGSFDCKKKDNNNDTSTNLPEEFKTHMAVSMLDKNFKKVLMNAQMYNIDLFIKDVNEFDFAIFETLKHNIREEESSIVLVGGFDYIYSHETYKYSASEKYKNLRISQLNKLENNLISALADIHEDFNENGEPRNDEEESIINQLSYIHKYLQLLEDERSKLEEERELQQKYEYLNMKYQEITAIYIGYYRHPLSFKIFDEFVSKNNLLSSNITQEECAILIDVFFKCSFPAEMYKSSFTKMVVPVYDISEILQYQFDYTFISSYTDVIYRIRNIIDFDIEISAGSLENNAKIYNLLKENSNKTILIKNTEYLPKIFKKSGTNRFVFILDANEQHLLMSETRIVYFDRELDYNSIFENLKRMVDFDGSDRSNRLLHFHSVVSSKKFDFSIKDLDLCLKNKHLTFDYLTELVYFDRMSKIQKSEVIEMLNSYNFKTKNE